MSVLSLLLAGCGGDSTTEIPSDTETGMSAEPQPGESAPDETDVDGSSGGGSQSGGTASPALGGGCSTPGIFSCAEVNPRLVLSCGADRLWGSEETCPSNERCGTSSEGVVGCQAQLPECADDPSGVFCAEKGVDVHRCSDGGYGVELERTCRGGCRDGACVVDDNLCLGDLGVNCDPACGAESGQCWGTRSCDEYAHWSGSVEDRQFIRVSFDSGFCSGFPCDDMMALHADTGVAGGAVRFEFPAGWRQLGMACEVEPEGEGCVVVPVGDPVFGETVATLIITRADASIPPGNLILEHVPAGTTCEQ